ncbi:Uncharacterised protein [Porphyromonas cangingivalis]|uniref:Uncharacterized protein n=1 Tax=Porphyromonas cangingivalis TaxID=36874 RepID=A0A1T4NQ55_PORCN|nr:hypothetical protein SAMN02745205_01965 [Porphyromonas cangingivalis]VEJ03626.1 Uncharacterised protein [Porphyromonas cangingivalis]
MISPRARLFYKLLPFPATSFLKSLSQTFPKSPNALIRWLSKVLTLSLLILVWSIISLLDRMLSVPHRNTFCQGTECILSGKLWKSLNCIDGFLILKSHKGSINAIPFVADEVSETLVGRCFLNPYLIIILSWK